MTWGEFKKKIEDDGVTDDMIIDYMDFNSFDTDHIGIGVSIDGDSFSVH